MSREVIRVGGEEIVTNTLKVEIIGPDRHREGRIVVGKKPQRRSGRPYSTKKD